MKTLIALTLLTSITLATETFANISQTCGASDQGLTRYAASVRPEGQTRIRFTFDDSEGLGLNVAYTNDYLTRLVLGIAPPPAHEVAEHVLIYRYGCALGRANLFHCQANVYEPVEVISTFYDGRSHSPVSVHRANVSNLTVTGMLGAQGGLHLKISGDLGPAGFNLPENSCSLD